MSFHNLKANSESNRLAYHWLSESFTASLAVCLIVAGCSDAPPSLETAKQPNPQPASLAKDKEAPEKRGDENTVASSNENKTVKPDEIVTGFHERAKQQSDALKEVEIFSDFTFSDQIERSGITFVHKVVDDAGKHYKPVHYDHGNGVAVADVDSDGLLDIYFTNQIGSNALYRNSGNGRFEDITATAGVELTDRVSVAPAFADIDNDGDPDLFVTTVRMGNVLYENQGDGTFRNITEASGLGYLGHSSGSTFFDYNRDGLLDLFLTNVGVYTTEEKGDGGYYVGFRDGFSGHIYPDRTESSLLYENLGENRFREVSQEKGLNAKGWNGDVSVCDVNRDAWPDLYVLSMQGDDVLYINEQGNGFSDQTAQYFPRTPWGAMGVQFLDFNLDGIQDLFVTDMHSDMNKAQTVFSKTDTSSEFEAKKSEAWCAIEYTEEYLQGAANNIFGNAFYISSPEGQYEEVSDSIGAETFWPWGLSAGDLNADGYPDVFVTAGMGFGYRYGINSVLLNDSGKRFLAAEFPLGVEPRTENMKTAFELDCSGADRSHPLCQGRSGSIPFLEAKSTRSSVCFDVENDGDLDIVSLDMNGQPLFLVSNLSDQKPIRFVKLRLVGSVSNRDGLGATVLIETKSRRYTKYHDGKSGYLAQSSSPLYFGLGARETVERVTVTWPSGKAQIVSDGIKLNSVVTIAEE